MINFSIDKLVSILLPTVLRQPVHLAWLNSLLAVLAAEWASYTAWRADKNYKAHVTAQTLSLEAYLNRLFDPLLRRIKITHSNSNDFYISLWSEPDGRYFNAETGVFLYLEGEQGDVISDGFFVEIPPGLDQVQIAGIVDSIKAAGVKYEIIVKTL